MTSPSKAKDIALSILAVLFPPVCLGCGHVEGVRSLPLGLCRGCRDRLQPAKPPCLRPTEDSSTCLDCVVSRWSYRPPFDRVVRGLKFGRLRYLGIDLAAGLQRLVPENLPEIDVIVPIPLHWTRLRSRGFNQAEVIARPLASRLSLRMVPALRRKRRTAAQTLLDRDARRRNLDGAFSCRRATYRHVTGQRIVLVDDVVTTGATLESAAQCLIDAGAHSVCAATAGRTPVAAANRSGRPHTRRGEVL